MDWLKNRWHEPESRAGAAAALTALAGYVSGAVDAKTLGLALMGAILAFVFPSLKGIAK